MKKGDDECTKDLGFMPLNFCVTEITKGAIKDISKVIIYFEGYRFGAISYDNNGNNEFEEIPYNEKLRYSLIYYSANKSSKMLQWNVTWQIEHYKM